jgi:sulfotransferase
MQQFYFLAGLPRTGNTLLSSLLNQNPDIYSSPLSPVLDHINTLDNSIYNNQHILNSDYAYRTENVIRSIIYNHYADIDKPIVIDREKAWGTPHNLQLLKKYINANPKIIFTTRPIIEILTSYILIDNNLIQRMKDKKWKYNKKLTENDNKCDFLMRAEGEISHCLTTIKELQNLNNKKTFHVVQYNTLINDPQKTINQIYNFLELKHYKHNFNNIEKIENEDTTKTGWPANLHTVRPQLEKISKDPKEVLSEYVISKYSNIGWEGL